MKKYNLISLVALSFIANAGYGMDDTGMCATFCNGLPIFVDAGVRKILPLRAETLTHENDVTVTAPDMASLNEALATIGNMTGRTLNITLEKGALDCSVLRMPNGVAHFGASLSEMPVGSSSDFGTLSFGVASGSSSVRTVPLASVKNLTTTLDLQEPTLALPDFPEWSSYFRTIEPAVVHATTFSVEKFKIATTFTETNHHEVETSDGGRLTATGNVFFHRDGATELKGTGTFSLRF